jgi:hypothetical protein
LCFILHLCNDSIICHFVYLLFVVFDIEWRVTKTKITQTTTEFVERELDTCDYFDRPSTSQQKLAKSKSTLKVEILDSTPLTFYIFSSFRLDEALKVWAQNTFFFTVLLNNKVKEKKCVNYFLYEGEGCGKVFLFFNFMEWEWKWEMEKPIINYDIILKEG